MPVALEWVQRLVDRVSRLVGGAWISDSRGSASEPQIVFSCADVDRGGEREGLLFSPILSSIAGHYQRRGRRTANLSHPVTRHPASQVLGGASTLNRAYLDTKLRREVETLLRGRSYAVTQERRRLIGMYRKALHRLRAEALFSIQPPRALCMAAHEFGIPVIEPLHGMHYHPTNLTFRSWIEGVPDVELADVFLAFDSRSHATLQELLDGRPARSILITHPWHVEVQRPESTLLRDVSPLDTLTSRYRGEILITLQWGYDGEKESFAGIIPNGIMHPAQEDAIRHGPADILWLVRLHPVQLRGRRYARHRAYVRDLARRYPNVEIELASTLPLPLLLSRCEGHLSMISGAVGEAAQFGVPSLMLCPTLRPGGAHAGMFAELVAEGDATLGVLDADAILDWVANCMDRRQRPSRDWAAEMLHLEDELDRLVRSPQRVGEAPVPSR